MHSVLTNSFVRKRSSRLVACLAIALLSALAAAGIASASTSQYSVMQDDGHLLGTDDAVRTSTLDEMQTLGVDVVKVGALWRNYAPKANSNSQPNVDTADPANYDWGRLQTVVDGIVARGMQPWVMISSPGPNWSTARSTAATQEGVYQPDPVEFGKFAEAIAKHFTQVKIWSIGNEPNFQYWLWPQVGKGLVSLSAVHYRKMYVEARAGLSRAGADGDQILFGGLAPRAFLPKVGQRATQPITFLRDMLCLDVNDKPLKGGAAKARGCTGKFAKIDATGFAYHPYTEAGGPLVKPTSPNDAPIAYLNRVYRVLDAAAKYKRVSTHRMPLWDGEFGYQSDPPDPLQASIGRIPGFLNTAEYLSYKDPRVKTYHQFELLDDPADKSVAVGNKERYAGFQSGLRFENGNKKPGIYVAYQLPFMVFKTTSNNTVKVWGGVRANKPGGASVDIQIKSGGSFTTVKTVTVSSSNRYFNTTVKTNGAASKNFRFVVSSTTSSSNAASRVVKPAKPVKAQHN